MKYKQLRYPNAVLIAGALLASPVIAQEGIDFTSDQVASGEAIYVQHCQMCHGTNLDNGQFATPIKGFFFHNNWGGETLGELVRYVTNEMPPGNSGVLRTGQHLDVIAFILEANGIEPGEEAMTLDYEKMDQVNLPW